MTQKINPPANATDNPEQPGKPINQNYEAAIQELELILNQLESNDLPLEDAIKQFESGVALVKHCQTILDKTEQKITYLTGDDGEDKPAAATNAATTQASDVPF